VNRTQPQVEQYDDYGNMEGAGDNRRLGKPTKGQPRVEPQDNIYQRQESGMNNDITSLGGWIITLLLMCIPCANIIYIIVCLVKKPEDQSRVNFIKAYAILMAASIVISIVLSVIIGASAISAITSLLR